VSDEFQTHSFWKSSFDESCTAYVQKSSFGCALDREPAAWPAGSPFLGDLAARLRQAPAAVPSEPPGPPDRGGGARARTILRGRTIALDGRTVGEPCGRVLRRGA
jgi:hypothetical protein